MNLNKAEIEFAASLIDRIDSGEKGIFLETVNTESQVEVKMYQYIDTSGVFYYCSIYGGLRIHISFENDTGDFNDDLATQVRLSLKKTGMTSCLIWVYAKNMKTTEFLKEKFHIMPDGAHYYSSIEFIMRRDKFNCATDQSILEIRPYEEKYIYGYLTLLDGAMVFFDPPPSFMEKREHYLQHLAEHGRNNSFEAFWKDGGLVGLYWRKNAEIDILAVDVSYQRMGYGTIILTQAISKVFQNTASDFAYLYAVNWNVKGQSFYKKYGMEQNGHMYLLRLNNYSEGL